MLTVEQKAEVRERVEQLIDMGNAHFGTACNVPYTRFDKRGTCGGTANYNKMELNFNAGLMVDNWDEYMNQIIPHEVAHIIKTHIWGYGSGKGVNSSHGYHWKRVMREAFGVEPTRTHDMDVSKVKQFKAPLQRYTYVCSCGCGREVQLTSVRHNRMVRGTHKYSVHGRHALVLKNSVQQGLVREAAVTKKPKRKEPAAGTKAAQALAIFREMDGVNRPEVIKVIMMEMNVTEKRAGEIYQGCKRLAKELG